ncbi:MAG: DUF86 domain-containing protein [Anaerolineae bacterium]|nr:DUF86 domain-containing protein [Anaerolineae bacterium]
MARDREALLDIAHAANLTLEFRQGMSEEDFYKDLKTQSAVLHQLLIMGEAVKRLSASFRHNHPEIDWKAIAGLRDILIHAYDTVDIELVWEIIDMRLPLLLKNLTPLLPKGD